MSVTERKAETATVEAKKPGESITESLVQAVNRYVKRIDPAIRTFSYNKDKKIGDCETILHCLCCLIEKIGCSNHYNMLMRQAS